MARPKGKRDKLTITLTRAEHICLHRLSAIRNTTMSDYVRGLIIKDLDKYNFSSILEEDNKILEHRQIDPPIPSTTPVRLAPLEPSSPRLGTGLNAVFEKLKEKEEDNDAGI